VLKVVFEKWESDAVAITLDALKRRNQLFLKQPESLQPSCSLHNNTYTSDNYFNKGAGFLFFNQWRRLKSFVYTQWYIKGASRICFLKWKLKSYSILVLLNTVHGSCDQAVETTPVKNITQRWTLSFQAHCFCRHVMIAKTSFLLQD